MRKPVPGTNVPIRLLTAVPLCDGHDSAISTINLELIRHGIEVVYLGYHRSVRDIVRAAVQEDVAAVGISSYNGGGGRGFFGGGKRVGETGGGGTAAVGGGGGGGRGAAVGVEARRRRDDHGARCRGNDAARRRSHLHAGGVAGSDGAVCEGPLRRAARNDCERSSGRAAARAGVDGGGK